MQKFVVQKISKLQESKGEQVFIFLTQAWTSWASCSKTCGGGEQERRRKDEVETRLCSTQKCPSKCTTESKYKIVLISLQSDLNCIRKFAFLESLFVDFNSIHFANKRDRRRRPKEKLSKARKKIKVSCPSSHLVVIVKDTNLKPR